MTYAVTNPATGETVRTYETITDAQLEAAIAAADERRSDRTQTYVYRKEVLTNQSLR